MELEFKKIIESLKQGNLFYSKQYLKNESILSNFFNAILGKILKKQQATYKRKDLLSRQKPQVIVLSCSDSRVVPEFIFNKSLGELFVVRVAGNTSNPESIASIEYAVTNCDSKVIIVLGHESCGAVTIAAEIEASTDSSIADSSDLNKHLTRLLSHIKPVIQKSKNLNLANLKKDSASLSNLIEANAIHSANNLLKESKIISMAINNNNLKIFSAFYSLKTGLVKFLKN